MALLNPHFSLLEPQLNDPDRTELTDACLAGVLALPPLDPLCDRDGDGGDAPYSEVGGWGGVSIPYSWGYPFCPLLLGVPLSISHFWGYPFYPLFLGVPCPSPTSGGVPPNHYSWGSPVLPPLLGVFPPLPIPGGTPSISLSWGCPLHPLFLGVPCPSPTPGGVPSIP